MFISPRNKGLRTTRNVCLSIVLAGPLACYGQNTTGNAKAAGTCIVANTGPNAKISQNCLVVSPALFKEFKAIAQSTKRNSAELKSVLDQLDAISKELEGGEKQQVITAPNGIAIGGGTVTNPTVNNNSFATPHPPPSIDWKQIPKSPSRSRMDGDLGKNPGVLITIGVNGVFYNPAFVILCDRPCSAVQAGTDGASSAQMLSTPANPNITGAAFTMPSQLYPGVHTEITVRSQDAEPITILKVGPYIPPAQR